MKVCKYCNTEINDGISKCNSCGANEMSNKCNNCGTIFDSTFCPSCGIKADEKPKICKNCGTKSFEMFCPKCGTDLLHNENKNIDDSDVDNNNIFINIDTTPEIIIPYNPNPRKKRSKVFPVIISIIVISCFVGFIGAVYNSIPTESNNAASTIGVYESEPDLDIVKKAGHPLFYGNFIDAKKFWENYKKVKVADSANNNEDALLLVTNGNGADEKIITNISFNFSNTKDKDKLTMDEVLKIACDYIPYDIINKYYKYKISFKETSTFSDYFSYYYIMDLNENGKKVKDFNYEAEFAFSISCYDKNDWFVQISSNAGDAKYKQVKVGSYEVEDWNVNINSYNKQENKSNVKDVKNDAVSIYNQVQTYYKAKSYDKAKQALSNLSQKYPNSEEAKRGKQLLVTIDIEIKKAADKAQLLEQQKKAAEKKRLAESIKKMRKDIDEVQEITWYFDKNSSQYANRNNFYIYFGTEKDSKPWMRLKIQYAADDWLFLNQYIFKVDDKTFKIYAGNSEVKRDKNRDGIWEVYDTDLDYDNYQIIKAIISSKKTVIRHQGKDYYKDRVITDKEKQGLRNVLDAYQSLRGKLSF